MPGSSWSTDELATIDAATELEIAVRRADGTLRDAVPVWVVIADDQVYVRTWYRRDTGWFGRVLRTRRARIGVPGLVAEVTVDDLGSGGTEVRAAVDSAYRRKYAAGAGRMVGDEASATTLRLVQAQATHE